jgi:hypothetical protein
MIKHSSAIDVAVSTSCHNITLCDITSHHITSHHKPVYRGGRTVSWAGRGWRSSISRTVRRAVHSMKGRTEDRISGECKIDYISHESVNTVKVE